jgi:hypothetical protein
MTDTFPWYALLALGLVGLFVLLIVLIFLYAFLEGWWLSRQSIPSRFEKLQTEFDFVKSALPEIAQKIGMTQADQIPSRLSRQVLNAMPKHWKGAEFLDILIRKERDGVCLLCNVRREEKIYAPDTSGEDKSISWTEIDSITISAFWQSSEPYLPAFFTRPFIDYLSVKLAKLLGLKGVGHPRFEDDPEFHEKLLISTAEPEEVRPVLTDRVRNVLKENCDLTTSISGPVIVLYDDGHPFKYMMRRGPEDGDTLETCKVLAAEEWPRFFDAARSVITALRQAVKR